jgi:hypothetical protein
MKPTGAVSILVVAILGCQGDRPLTSPGGPLAEIRDAQHNQGNAFFFWLPPTIQQQPPTTQVFSRALRPVVTIQNLCPNGGTVRTFSGPQIQVSNDHYLANWHTDEDNLDPACTYRMTVSVGSHDLGFADVDVVSTGRELKNVNTNEFIPLLDDRTLPIKFFIGVGSLCRQEAGVDCGEGTARPGENTTIVTTNGRAGTFIPAGAVDHDVTIIVESANDRPCINGLLGPAFAGRPTADANSCYDFHTDPPLSRINEAGVFNTNVTVGICADFGLLDHTSVDLLQIFQLDLVGDGTTLRALNNVPAPFLRCDPAFSPSFGSARRGALDLAARALGSALGPLALLAGPPQPLFAGTRTTMFDLGAGGSADGFSRFVWSLPIEVTVDFDRAVDGGVVAAGTAVNSLYSRVGVTFSRTNPEGLCSGTGVYANDHGAGGFNSGQNNVTPCPEGVASDFSDDEYGAIEARFALPSVRACIGVTPLGTRNEQPGVGYIEALDASGAVVDRKESSPERVPQTICVSQGESAAGIASVRFAGGGAGFAVFDNLFFARAVPPIQ